MNPSDSPDSLLDGIRRQANKVDAPYQSPMKAWLTENHEIQQRDFIDTDFKRIYNVDT
jgi:hypothetical protein